MARLMTGDRLIESVRNRTMTPDDTSIYDDDHVLNIIDEEMTSQVLDKLLVLHGENLTIPVDIPKNAKGEYEIPYRAIGNKLRDASLVRGKEVYELSQVGIGELPDFSSQGIDSISGNDLFYIENNKLKLVNPNIAYDSIRLRYYLKPNSITKTKEAGVISDIVIDENAGTISLVLSQVGKKFTATDLYDIVGKRSPNKIKSFDNNVSSLTVSSGTGTIVFSLDEIGSDYSEISIGDYVTLAGETPVPNIPSEMHPLLAQAAAVQLLEGMTDTEALRNAENRLDKITKAVQELIDDRVELAPKKIKPRNGTLQQQIRGYKKGRY